MSEKLNINLNMDGIKRPDDKGRVADFLPGGAPDNLPVAPVSVDGLKRGYRVRERNADIKDMAKRKKRIVENPLEDAVRKSLDVGRVDDPSDAAILADAESQAVPAETPEVVPQILIETKRPERFSHSDTARIWLAIDTEGQLRNMRDSLLIGDEDRETVSSLLRKIGESGSLSEEDFEQAYRVSKELEKERDRELELLNQVDICVHGSVSRNFETHRPVFEGGGDLDTVVSLWLMKKYAGNKNAENPHFLFPGRHAKGALNIDTGGREGYIVNKETGTRIADHHPSVASRYRSAAGVVNEVLDETSRLRGLRLPDGEKGSDVIGIPEKDKKAIGMMLDFLGLIDNADFKVDADYFEKSSSNLIGLSRFIRSGDAVFAYFDKNKKKDFEDLVYGKLDNRSLKELGLSRYVGKREAELNRNKDEFERMGKEGLIVEDSVGNRISIDIDKKASDGFNAARAKYEIDRKESSDSSEKKDVVHIIWSPAKMNYFLSSTGDLSDKYFGEGWKRVRGKMLLYDVRNMDAPKEKLADVLENLGVDVDTLKKEKNELGYFLMQEELEQDGGLEYLGNKLEFVLSKYKDYHLERRIYLEQVKHEAEIALERKFFKNADKGKEVKSLLDRVEEQLAKTDGNVRKQIKDLFGKIQISGRKWEDAKDANGNIVKGVKSEILGIWERGNTFLSAEDIAKVLEEKKREIDGPSDFDVEILNSSLEKKIDSLTDKKAKSEELKREIHELIASFQDRIKAQSEELAEIKAEDEKKDLEIAGLTDKIAQLGELIGKLDESIERLGSKVGETKEDVIAFADDNKGEKEELLEQLNGLQAVLSEMDEQMEKAQAQIDELSEDKRQLLDASGNLREAYNQERAKVGERDEVIVRLSDEKADLQKSLDESSAIILEKEKIIAELTEQIAAKDVDAGRISSEKNEALLKNEALEKELNEERMKNSESAAENESLMKRIEDINGRYGKISAEVGELRNKLAKKIGGKKEKIRVFDLEAAISSAELADPSHEQVLREAVENNIEIINNNGILARFAGADIVQRAYEWALEDYREAIKDQDG